MKTILLMPNCLFLNNKNIVLDLAGNKIKCEKEVKLLEVTIDFELKFTSHISNICKKSI
jgi:hypothetical protein